MTVEAPAAPAAAAPATTPAPSAAPAPAAAAPAPAAEPAKPAAAAPAPAAAPKPTILGGQPAAPAPTKEGQTQGAPEKYTDFTLPDGLSIDKPLMEKFSTTAKDLGLSQESAQKLVDLQAQTVKAEIDARLQSLEKQSETWSAEAKAHFGATWEKDFGIASKAIERFGTPALRQLLVDAGLANHPEIVKFCHAAGSKVSEDQPLDGRRAGGETKSTAELMFDKMPSKKT